MSEVLVVLVVTLYSTTDGSTRVDISPPLAIEDCISRKATVDIPRNYTLINIDCTVLRREQRL